MAVSYDSWIEFPRPLVCFKGMVRIATAAFMPCLQSFPGASGWSPCDPGMLDWVDMWYKDTNRINKYNLIFLPHTPSWANTIMNAANTTLAVARMILRL